MRAVGIACCIVCEAHAIWRAWYLGIVIFTEMLEMWYSWRGWSSMIDFLAAHKRRHEFLQLINAIVHAVGCLWLLGSGDVPHVCA